MYKDNILQCPNTCCGGPALQNIESCCLADEDAKSAGNDGCGCAATEKLSIPVAEKSICCG